MFKEHAFMENCPVASPTSFISHKSLIVAVVSSNNKEITFEFLLGHSLVVVLGLRKISVQTAVMVSSVLPRFNRATATLPPDRRRAQTSPPVLLADDTLIPCLAIESWLTAITSGAVKIASVFYLKHHT
jgi:hypothetical protein